MKTTTLPELVALLRGPTLIVRTGLWLAPITVIGQEENEAARLGIDAVDIREPILAALPEGTRFLGLSAARIVEALETICHQPKLSDCILVYNLDLLLARLSGQDRKELWRQLLAGFPHRPRALLLVMPQHAHHLLPTEEVEDNWRRDRRLVDGFNGES